MALIRKYCCVCGTFVADPDIPGHSADNWIKSCSAVKAGMSETCVGESSSTVVLALVRTAFADLQRDPADSPILTPIGYEWEALLDLDDGDYTLAHSLGGEKRQLGRGEALRWLLTRPAEIMVLGAEEPVDVALTWGPKAEGVLQRLMPFVNDVHSVEDPPSSAVSRDENGE